MRGGNAKLATLRRKRIDDMLDNIWGTSVTFITAPVGYGKTTAVKEYFKDFTDMNIEWFSFKNGELDVIWFFDKIEKIKESGEESPGIWVFDDYHEADSAQMNHIIESVAEKRIPGFHLIVIQRNYQNMAYEEMVMKNKCVLIEQNDLAMTLDEIREFFFINNLPCTENTVEECLEYTGGWMAAVYLSLINYRDYNRINGRAETSSLIKKGILMRLSDDERNLLIEMSILNEFTGEEAEWITKIPDADSILRGLLDKIGFLYYNEKNHFVMHSLLRNACIEEFLRLGFKKEDILIKAAKWYVKENNYSYAIYIYCETGMFEKAIELIDSSNKSLLFSKEPIIFSKIFLKMRPEDKLNPKSGYVIYILSMMVYGNYEQGRKEYSSLKKYFDKTGKFPLENKEMLHYILIVESLWEFNDIEKMINVLKRAEKIRGDKRVKELESLWNSFVYPDALLSIYNTAGRFREIKDMGIEYVKLLDTLANGDEVYVSVVQAEYFYQLGEFEKAEQIIDSVFYEAEFGMDIFNYMTAGFLLCRIYIMTGENEKSEDIYARILEKIKNSKNEQAQLMCEIYGSGICAMCGKTHQISLWIKTFTTGHVNNYIKMTGTIHTIYGKYLIAGKRYIELSALAENMKKPVSCGDFILKKITADIFSSIAYYHMDAVADAKEYLINALALAKKDGVAAVFAEFYADIAPVISKITEDEFILKIKNLSMKRQSKNKDILTAREKEIMELVEKGYKNSQIGEELHLAVITVEKNLTNIYRKLGVRNRAGAVIEYQKLKL